jgi:fimbrial chaperone protein
MLLRAAMASSLACAAAALVPPAPAVAGTLRIDPIKIELSQDHKIASLKVKNEDGAPVSVRAYVLAWSQVDGEDRYQETESLIVSPPVATIAPGATQVIRVGFRGSASARAAYRLIVEEVPQANRAGGIQVALRLSIPLYANVAQGVVSELRWKAYQLANGKWALEAANPGDRYVRAEVADVAAATGIRPANVPGFAVVLPKSARRWVLPGKPDVADRGRYETVLAAARADGPSHP